MNNSSKNGSNFKAYGHHHQTETTGIMKTIQTIMEAKYFKE
jgi:hypothetical protein